MSSDIPNYEDNNQNKSIPSGYDTLDAYMKQNKIVLLKSLDMEWSWIFWWVWINEIDYDSDAKLIVRLDDYDDESDWSVFSDEEKFLWKNLTEEYEEREIPWLLILWNKTWEQVYIVLQQSSSRVFEDNKLFLLISEVLEPNWCLHYAMNTEFWDLRFSFRRKDEKDPRNLFIISRVQWSWNQFQIWWN